MEVILRDILAELKAIRRLLENDGRSPGVEAIGKPLPRGPQLTDAARADTPIKEIAAAVMARAHMVNGETPATVHQGRVMRNLVNIRARALRGS